MFAFVAVALLAAEPTARVSRPPLPGFVVGHEASQAGASILEEVPAGETVHKWSRMVTTQRFEGVAFRTSPARFLGMLASGAMATCPGATASDVREEGGARLVRLDCPKNANTGLPETFVARAMDDGADLHVFQVAWRSVPTPSDITWAETYLKGIKLTPRN